LAQRDTHHPPLRVVCIISKWAADAFGKASLYDELIKMYNYPHFDQRHDSVYNETANNTVASLQALLQATPFSGFPVVTSLSEMHIVGFMSRSNMEAVLQQALDECAAESPFRHMLHNSNY
jgi:chloride channel 3/4/5